MDNFTKKYIEDSVDCANSVNRGWLAYQLEAYHNERTKKEQPIRVEKPVQILTMKHIHDTVWIISTETRIEVNSICECVFRSSKKRFPTRLIRVHDRWSEATVYRYVVTEVLNE